MYIILQYVMCVMHDIYTHTHIYICIDTGVWSGIVYIYIVLFIFIYLFMYLYLRVSVKVKSWATSTARHFRWGAPSGPNLPRERVTEAALTGEVVEWKDCRVPGCLSKNTAAPAERLRSFHVFKDH